MQRVLNRLFVADLAEASDPLFLKLHDVQAIMYFGDGGMFSDEIKLYHRRAQPDGTLSKDQLTDGIEFLRESLRAGRRVLAVGKTGATIVTAYLMEMGFNAANALDLLGTGTGSGTKPDEGVVSYHESELERRASIALHKDTV